MWFKQVQLFQLSESLRFSIDSLTEKLHPLTFTPCFPSMFSSMGWSSSVDEEGAPLVRAYNGCMMICLLIEEKILPAAVINQELIERVKKIEATENRKVYRKEKMSLKDEVVLTLLPRAFSKMTRVHAYIDTKNHWLVLGTANAKKTEQFISFFKKSISEEIKSFEIRKPSSVVTPWLTHQNYPSTFSVEKACVLQDSKQLNRVIRCQEQDLFSHSIQSLIKDGCEVKQLALTWHDCIHFVLKDDFSLGSIKYQDEVTAQANEIDTETKQQQFDADFLIMSEALSGLLKELLGLFIDENQPAEGQFKAKKVAAMAGAV